MREPILILGASVRAAAHSAVRGGFRPIAVDMFADLDLAAICPATKVSDYPADLESIAQLAPPCPWIYTGALENYPTLVDRIAAARPLLGNPGSILGNVRDPLQMADALSRDGLPVPLVHRGDQPPRAGQWLRKRIRSSGGHGIQFYPPAQEMGIDCGEDHDPTDSRHRGTYFQQFIAGEPCSAVYVAARAEAVLLGTTRQLVGVDWLGADGFRYAASIGPLQLDATSRASFERIGSCLAHRFKLQGLFGVDVIRRGQEVWPVEINPRYTASVEVLERGLAIHAVSMHVEACRAGQLPKAPALEASCRYFGKAIKYCREDIVMPPKAVRFACRINADALWPTFADLPHAGTLIRSGQPLATALASGDSVAEVEGRLQELWQRFDERLSRARR